MEDEYRTVKTGSFTKAEKHLCELKKPYVVLYEKLENLIVNLIRLFYQFYCTAVKIGF